MRWQLSFWFFGVALLLTGCAAAKTGGADSAPAQTEVVRLFARGGEFDPAIIELKALREVKLKITSFDYDYVIYIPGLGVSLTRIPALATIDIPLTPLRVGAHEILASGRNSMKGLILVEVCPPESKAAKSPFGGTPDSVAAGKALYSQRCASCHGAEGRGDGPAAQGLGIKPVDFTAPYMANIADGELFWVTSQGFGKMPSFKGTLTDEERWHLVDYLRSLSSK